MNPVAATTRLSARILKLWTRLPVLLLIWLGMLAGPVLSLPAATPPPTTPNPPPDDPLQRITQPLPTPPKAPFDAGKFSIRPGEVIVFTGPTHMVFEQQQGWLETLLATSAKEQRPVFRHMGWEGDTVYAQPRHLNFGSWKQQFEAAGASMIFTWFGQMEALDDSHSAEDFEQAYATLLDEFMQVTPRIVVLGPLPFFRPDSPLVPDNTGRIPRIQAHAAVAARLAKQRGLIFVDLLAKTVGQAYLDPLAANRMLTSENGVHLPPIGQDMIARLISSELIPATPEALKWENLLQEHGDIRREIIAKNRHWFDAWRTMNWAFAYGDRTTQLFGQGIDGRPKMAEELELYKTLITNADARIHALALGQQPPLPARPLPEILPSPESPEIERRTFKLREGFDVNLFASEANGLVKPLQIRWDSRGRLWAACAPSYPQLVPGVPPQDYLMVCEDTDGDGRADKFTRFAEGLIMPMGLEFGDGGVYVCESTQLIHLRDTDGDGKADERRVILSGFGTGDSHQLINSLRWGPDGRLWFSQGLHIDARVETPWGIAAMDKAGIWRFNPRTLQLHDFFGGAVAGANCWGVAFDDWGQVFHVAADNRMAFYSTPGLIPVETPERYYEIGPLAVSRVKGMELEFLGSRHLPDDMRGALVKSTYFMNSVLLFKLVDDGSGFRTEELGELISSSETAFRPLETKLGPDGAIYICDWFNPVIGHYQASYRDPKRDKVHGRIWRVTAKNRPLDKSTNPASLDTKELVDLLLSAEASPERWLQEQTRQELFNRPTVEVIPVAESWLKANGTAASAAALREVIGLYAAHEVHDAGLLARALASPDARLRAWGTRFIGLWAANVSSDPVTRPRQFADMLNRKRIEEPLPLIAKMVADPSARVRLEAVVAASYIARPEAIEVAARVLDLPHDRFIDYALRQCARALKPHWQPALAAGKLTFDGKSEHLAFVVQADASKDSIAQIRQLVESGNLPATAREGLLVALVNVGDPDDLAFALSRGQSSTQVLNELATAATVRNKRPSVDLPGTVRQLLSAGEPALKVAGLQLAAAWKTTGLVQNVQSLMTQDGEDLDVRVAAVATFATLKGKESASELAQLAGTSTPPVARAALAAMVPLDLAAAASLAAKSLAGARTDQDAAAVLHPFLSRQTGTTILSKALASQPPAPDGAKLALQALGTLGRDEPALREVLYKAAGLLVMAAPDYRAELVVQLIAAAGSSGDAQRGQALFRSPLTACLSCHKIGAEGGDTGPDLTAIGRGMTPELIVESVLWPKRQIKEGFFLTQITTTDGAQFQGYIQSENASELALRDPATGVESRLRKQSIKERQDTGTLMPEGLTAALTREQLQDLLKYLLELGR